MYTKFFFTALLLGNTFICASEFQNKYVCKQVNDYFNTFIDISRNNNLTIDSFINNNEEDFEIFVDIFKARTQNKALELSNGIGFMAERFFLNTVLESLFTQAVRIDEGNENNMIRDFLFKFRQLEEDW